MAVDMTKVPSTADYNPAPGTYMARLVRVVEEGKQKTTFNGTERVQNRIRLQFELYGDSNVIKLNDGSVAFKTIDTGSITYSASTKSNTFKYFSALRAASNKPDATTFKELLGVGVMVTLEQNGKYINLSKTNLPTKAATLDPATGNSIPLTVPQPKADTFYFDWDNPTMEAWQKLFIPGTKDDGTPKNWLQERLLDAENFKGSPLDMMLNGLADSLDDSVPDYSGAADATEASEEEQALAALAAQQGATNG